MLRNISRLTTIPIISRGIYTVTPTASDILDHGKEKGREAMANHLVVTEKTNCYECYKVMDENHVNYLRVVRDDLVIGVLKRADVKELMLFHQFEQGENDKILEEFRKNGQ